MIDGITISDDGTVTGATDAFWSDLDDMFQLNQCENVMAQLTDSRGLVVFRQKASNHEMIIQTGSFSKGIYLLSVMKNGRVESRKLILN